MNAEQLREGARVEAVNFWLDEGLRIWPVQSGPHEGKWRLVRVADQRVHEMTAALADFHVLQAEHPDAKAGINDNESVPPGTLGTVESVNASGQVWVAWDNGRRLAFTEKDTYRIV